MDVIALGLHGVAATLWIGGIFFAFVALRPAAEEVLEPQHRLILWRATYRNFFRFVWVFVVVLLGTGYYGLFYRFGGFADSPPYLHLMHTIGLIMVGIFCYLYFALYRPFSRLIDGNDVISAPVFLKKIRLLMASNLVLGIAITAVGICGPFLAF
jgi:uncharacterized membrane protein